jgi:hypothetical protein
MICQYCNKEAKFVDSKAIYRKSYGMIYLCKPCDAYVGAHEKSGEPLGTLANKELRTLRKIAHSAFDPLWKRKMAKGTSKFKARNAGYAWLAEKMGIPLEDCHIAMLNEEQCCGLIELCEPYLEALGD